jgi:acetylornithine/succinyldiaminopimelate/putrescine aminotransferase
MHQLPSIAETCDQLLREQEPNFLRLYLNPHVVQTCFCLDRYVSTTWATRPDATVEDCQSFLANGLEEALSGAIKLVRYNQETSDPRSTGLILDPADRLAGFVSAELAGGGSVPFLPGLRVVGSDAPGLETLPDEGGIHLLVLVAGADDFLDKHQEAIRRLVRLHSPRVITCVDRQGLAAIRGGRGGILREIVPDIVVFDESFAGHAVPFGAFTARKSLFACWNQPGKATFHSTTFQPNTISSLHFLRCLAEADPEFHARYRDDFHELSNNLSCRRDGFRRYYNPSLYRLIRASGFDTNDVRAAGSFIVVDGRPIFDVVGGVACSIRGHNPPAYAGEMKALSQEGTVEAAPSAGEGSAVEAELRRRLEDLTGLACFLPAVSGASAVENALKLALVARFPRRHILALKAGFGGKTLFALTGTANPSYKERIDPLYADVHYVDPFAPDARARIDALMETHEFAAVQLELIQSVGGVRPIPADVIRHLDEGRKRRGYLLLVDEVQTGMYRTGPFILSKEFDLTPDLLLLGKGTSDMMFPFALTLYSSAVDELLDRQGTSLRESIRARYGYEQGYKTVVNVLRMGDEGALSRQVAEASALFAELLSADRFSGKFVRDVRIFGLLIGLELDARRRPHRWLRKRLSALYLLSMLRHAEFPVLAGFCQYEPNVLKITPPLNASPDEIRKACATIVEVLRRPLHRVLAAGLGSLIGTFSGAKHHDEHANRAAVKVAAL